MPPVGEFQVREGTAQSTGFLYCHRTPHPPPPFSLSQRFRRRITGGSVSPLKLGEAVGLGIRGAGGLGGFHSSSQTPINSPGRSYLLYRVKLRGHRLRNSFQGAAPINLDTWAVNPLSQRRRGRAPRGARAGRPASARRCTPHHLHADL